MMKTAREILNSVPNLGKSKIIDDEAKIQRRTAHFEFQAFAYKMAVEFNDLQNLKIYLNLLKKVDRFIIEQAYSYAIDSTSTSKAKIFFWKIREMNKQINRLKHKSNFDWGYILKHNRKFRDSLVSRIFSTFPSTRSLDDFVLAENNITGDSLLILGYLDPETIKILSRGFKKIIFYDLSKVMRDRMRSHMLERFKLKVKSVTWRDPFMLENLSHLPTVLIDNLILKQLPIGLENHYVQMITSLIRRGTKISFCSLRLSQLNQNLWSEKEGVHYFHRDFDEKSLLSLKKLFFDNSNVIRAEFGSPTGMYHLKIQPVEFLKENLYG